MKKLNTVVSLDENLCVCSPRRDHAKNVVPLSMVRAGEHVTIHSISGKDDTRRFLCNLGLVEDATVSVVSEMGGNVIVNIKGTRLAISKAMASRVLTA
ncbi:FeoA family protein [Ethanoligenens harbinense]|uniref:FeoA family protein n=1 Tax=Ethanoligenens harbinense (strain DSM 18485 / JCM 12961 / CGMCC 1.5033 / YUAN-3) TaxID=663278 RepID=E6U4N2_ETHHY|nr:FeoA family protein [Ethanoligenens harbinense]ADU26660.1 FeoA family protein [Ethanoligenens harbinense YUAN-3]AVQ95778.1 ferrous iron transport protein A [Ethanoligenens harbinense YUAN-3]AYF38440.1 ferrous iron transport protein A [Ethanoligenens harbinense]AYF41185.1 ferrous iron transport protein A [Ethanoligenens harbinense]QCN92018.1 ferrous iron transport protein A [Ethanoligenens harbinense]